MGTAVRLPGRGHQIMGGRDCIFVNPPLFKAAFDPAGPLNGLLITTEHDGDAICRAYAAMREKSNAIVPNIDSTHNVIGGMSNRAHSIVAMFEKGDDRLRESRRPVANAESPCAQPRRAAEWHGRPPSSARAR